MSKPEVWPFVEKSSEWTKRCAPTCEAPLFGQDVVKIYSGKVGGQDETKCWKTIIDIYGYSSIRIDLIGAK